MKKYFLFIMLFLIWSCFLLGCRAKLETSRQESRQRIEEIGVELHRVDSLWGSIAERLNMKIEFYPPSYFDSLSTTNLQHLGGPAPIVPTDSHIGTLPTFGGSGGVGFGAVKSIEITAENEVTTNSATHLDSTYSEKTDTTEALQKEKTSELRHDNGTVMIVSIVAAVAFLILIYILIRRVLK